jgi:hypothetical protein
MMEDIWQMRMEHESKIAEHGLKRMKNGKSGMVNNGVADYIPDAFFLAEFLMQNCRGL